MENDQDRPTRKLDTIAREANNYPWVIAAIIEKEVIVDQMVEAMALYGQVPPDLLTLYRAADEKVFMRKTLMGVVDVEPHLDT